MIWSGRPRPKAISSGAEFGDNAHVKSKKNSNNALPTASPWVLYLLECENGAYYAGITTDLERRFAEHVFGIGARYTRANPPKRVVAAKDFSDRASASRAEAALKKLSRKDKPGFFGEAH